MTLFRIALRSHLGGFLATTAVAVLFALLNAFAYTQLAGTEPAARAVFARQMELLGRQLSYILPLPLELDTLAGYLQWRVFGAVALVYAFWALLAASGAGRGDEERGLVETWLAAGVGRARYLGVRSLAFGVALAASVALMMAAAWVGSVAVGEALAAAPLVLQGVDVLALTALCFALALAVAQLATTRRGAAGIAGIALLALFLVDSATRTGGLEQVRWLSPFWAYDRSVPLVRGGGLDVAATGALVVVAAIIGAAAAGAFGARDIGASLVRTVARTGHAVTRPSGDPLLRAPVLAALEQHRAWVLGWMVGLAAIAAFFVSLTRTIVDPLLAVPSMRAYFERLGPAGYDTFIAVIWGSTALLLLSLFAIFEVGTWVSDDAEGRLEAILAAPVRRARIVVERTASLLVAAALLVAAGSVAVWLAASRVDLALSGDRFAAGSALMIAVPLAFGGIGAVLASWRPRAAAPVLTVVAIASYFTQQFAPLFDWPLWVQNTSVFVLYGSPLATEVEWGGIVTLVAIGVAGVALSLVFFERRDVGS